MKRIISAIVTAATDFQKSSGSFISAMKLGMVIWPMNVKLMFRKALIPCTNVVPGAGKLRMTGSPDASVQP